MYQSTALSCRHQRGMTVLEVAGVIVMGENVSQAAQFAESGNAQVGFVALAHAVSPAIKNAGKFWIVPADYYPPLEQGVVIVAKSQHKKEAAEFLDFLKTKEASDVLRKYGFTIPHE